MRGSGAHDPSLNPNAYPMTDTVVSPSRVRIVVNGKTVGSAFLPDDPADHRGILSWFSQPHDRHLREAGTFGYLVNVPIPAEVLTQVGSGSRVVRVRFEVDDAFPGGLAIYGERFGRYPIDPTLGLILGD
jgi:predicted transcriptional regulator